MEHPADQPPVQQDSMEERGSDAEEKLSEEGKIFSSQLQPNSMEERGSDAEEKLSEEKGSEPKTDEEENSKENETQDRNSCTTLSDSERGSSPESSRKRKLNSRDDGTCERTGASPDERSATSEKKKQKVLDSGHGRESEEIQDASPGRFQRKRPGRSKRPRSRSPGDQPPPLRKTLLTSLRSMSEAIYQNIVNVYNHKGYSPPLREQLAQLRGPLFTAVLTTYAMANQAAYVFPAEGWLVPSPLPAPWGPAGAGGEGPCSKDSLPLP
ncbi:protein FRG2-like-1 [Kogia breviceps]|uniref:protein FRG2-like-1 n=1 Tax=Kogia breviceps TaxID=27615 RepID=UPI0027954036|nr:protein FRG2-like-1 [Kogia breviceps]